MTKTQRYILIRGKALKALKLQFAPVINVGSKTTQIGLFNFRSFLNLAMLLKESETAQLLRSKMLDIVIDTINQRTGGGTKFINRRDANYLPSAIQGKQISKKIFFGIKPLCKYGKLQIISGSPKKNFPKKKSWKT